MKIKTRQTLIAAVIAALGVALGFTTAHTPSVPVAAIAWGMWGTAFGCSATIAAANWVRHK